MTWLKERFDNVMKEEVINMDSLDTSNQFNNGIHVFQQNFTQRNGFESMKKVDPIQARHEYVEMKPLNDAPMKSEVNRTKNNRKKRFDLENPKHKKWLVVMILLPIGLLVGILIGVFFLKKDNHAFLIKKTQSTGKIALDIVAGDILNKAKFTNHKINGKVHECTNLNVNSLFSGITSQRRENSQVVVVIDLTNAKCKALLSSNEMMKAKISALVLLNADSVNQISISSALKYLTSFPVVGVDSVDLNYSRTILKVKVFSLDYQFLCS